MSDSVVGIGWDLLKSYVVVPMERGFGYVISSKRFANRLGQEVLKLENEVERVGALEEQARNNVREFHVVFLRWKGSADQALAEARQLLDVFEKDPKTCCYGTLPDPKSRYRFSREAEDKIEIIKQLTQNCIRFRALDDICFINSASRNVAALTLAGIEGKDVVQPTAATASTSSASTSTNLGDDGVFESRALITQDIMDALANNSNSVVGVYGMGGVGKSTLLVDVESRIRKEKLFLVAKADVSENPDIKTIQGEIADALGLTDIQNRETIRGRRELLHRRLTEGEGKNKILIILDDLWKRLDLKSVGIPCGHDNKVIGCKLLLTSRDQNVLRIEMGCDKDFPLGELNEKEAKRLFEGLVGDKVYNDDFKPLVDEALHRCAGFPFLIVNMATYFRSVSLSDCKIALNQIKLSKNKRFDEDINNMLQLSYDHLKDEEKSLLVLCVAYGTSKPSFENLVRYGMGLRLFRKDDNMEEARETLRLGIRTLQASSLLLEDGDAYGFKIHDLVREFVTSVASRDHPLLVFKDKDKSIIELSKDKVRSCRAICFPYIDMKELPQELDCPELQIFLLSTNKKSFNLPVSLFYSTRKLMVINLTGMHLTFPPSPFHFLENLHTLCLDNCLLNNVAILGELKRLEILSLVNSNFHQLPKEIGQLVELRLLDLNHCSKLKIIEPGVLQSLVKLEELYMKNSFDQWNLVEQTTTTNAGLIELNLMKNLRTMHMYIPNPSMLPEDLNVGKLSKYEILIGRCWQFRSEYKGSTILKLKLDPLSNVLRKGCIQSILGKTDHLFLDGLDGIERSICALSRRGFPNLRHLQVMNSPSIHYIHQSPSHIDFETLESLILEDLINLEKLHHNHISSKSFSALKVIRVRRCHKMKVLFPLSLLRGLPQLEEIEVDFCKLMRGIVDADDGGRVELHNLHVLKLWNLPDIKSFFTVGTAPLSGTLDDQVGTQIAFFNRQQVVFSRLETLEIDGLDNVEILFFPSMIKSLTQLRYLDISNCKKMEAIIMEEEGMGLDLSETLAFPMLTELNLNNLESLMCFSHRKRSQETQSQDCIKSCPTTLFNQEVAFPNLENLYIKDMGNIKMIWHDQIPADSFSKLKLLSINECKKLVNVIPSFILGRLLSLETLTVKACDSLEVVFKLQPLNPLDGNSVARSPLKELKLDDLSMLNCVWDKELYHHIKFQCLRSITLWRCARLASLFSASIARDLIQLEELEINQCGIVELIEKEGPDELSINVEDIEGPSHELKVTSSFPSYFQHMKTLDVSYCHGLSNMFTPTMATNLVELTKLRISKCEILTEVISDEGGKEGHVMAFNQLKYMELDGLTRLRCFSSGGYTLIFPLLEDIIVNTCSKMKFFHEGRIETPKLVGVKVGLNEGYGATECEYFLKGNLNTTIQSMLAEMVTFAGIKFMWLYEFPELIGKWHGELNPVTSYWQLKTLVVNKCPSFINAIPSSLMFVLERMISLQVCDCEALEEIFDLEGLKDVNCTQVLPELRYLYLVNLPKLRQLWNKDLQGMMCFNSLWKLNLYKCSNLRHAFVPSMARCLPNLLWMEIKECDQMEGVIADEEGQGRAMEEITFPNLWQITLECLPYLTSFLLWKNHRLECPILSKLSIVHCPEMRSLTWQSSMEIDNGTPSLFTPQVQCPKLEQMFLSHMDNLSKIWSDGPQETLTFDNLRKVQVQNCRSLKNVFPCWVATSLTQLKELQVESCGIEEIVASGNETPHSNTTQDFFPKLTSLVLRDMPQLKNFCTNLPTLNWSFLKELRVTHCDKVNMLSFVASMSNGAQKDDQQGLLDQEAHSLYERDFPSLERLLLVDNNIQMIQDGNFPEDIFGKPKALTLACFHDENAIFPLKFLLEKFQDLQSLEVFCSSFKDIFLDEGLVDNGKHPVLESLEELKLNKLHNLKSVWREGSSVLKILQSIKTFEVWDCPCLTTIFPTMTSFKNLTTLVVKNSSGLVHLVTASMVTNLVNLKCMTIIGCERMKEIVANNGDGEGKVISFRNLYELTLQNLLNLECFSSIPSCIFRFPSLQNIEVEECPKMKTFSKGTLSTPKLGYASLFRYKWDENCGVFNDLNTTIQKLSA